MPKKGEKVVSEEQLEKLALARQKALEVRRANKEIKDKEKELVRLEKDEKRKNLDKRINAHKKEVDMAGNEVDVEHAKDNEENLELDVKPKSKPRASKKKVKYVYESDSSSSEEEVVVVRKKKSSRAKKTQESKQENTDTKDTDPVDNENAKPTLTPQEIQRQEYLRRASQMPQYRTNLFGGF